MSEPTKVVSAEDLVQVGIVAPMTEGMPVAERDRHIHVVSEYLRPHLGTLGAFATELGLQGVSTLLQLDEEEQAINVSIDASSVLRDGSKVEIRFVVIFEDLIGPNCISGFITATRKRPRTGAAGLQFFTTHDIFDDLEEFEELSPVMESLDLKAELAKVDFRPLRLEALFDSKVAQ